MGLQADGQQLVAVLIGQHTVGHERVRARNASLGNGTPQGHRRLSSKAAPFSGDSKISVNAFATRTDAAMCVVAVIEYLAIQCTSATFNARSGLKNEKVH